MRRALTLLSAAAKRQFVLIFIFNFEFSQKARLEKVLQIEQSDPASIISSYYGDSYKSEVKTGRRLPLDLWRWNLSKNILHSEFDDVHYWIFKI